MTTEMTLTYYAKLKKEKEGGYCVSFRDFPNIFSEGETINEALHNAQEALDGVLFVMMQEDREIAYPTAVRKNEYPVPVSPDIAAPILLHLLRNKCARSMAGVAKAMDVSYQQYQRLEHNCNMTLKSLKRAANAMGGRVEIKFYTND